jgi:hypothetical protein
MTPPAADTTACRTGARHHHEPGATQPIKDGREKRGHGTNVEPEEGREGLSHMRNSTPPVQGQRHIRAGKMGESGWTDSAPLVTILMRSSS